MAAPKTTSPWATPSRARAISALVGALEQVAARAGPHRGEHRLVVLEHGQHQHGRCRVRAVDLRGSPRRRSAPGMCRSITTTSGAARRRADRLRAVAGLADDLHARHRSRWQSPALAVQRMVVDHEHPNTHDAPAGSSAVTVVPAGPESIRS